MQGRCLCGNIRYRLDAAPRMTLACHCTDCQRQTGSAFSHFTLMKREKFHLDGKPKQYVTVGESGRKVTRHFCSDCGSPVFSELEKAPGIVVIPVGTLEDNPGLTPSRHSWVKHKQPWLTLEGAAELFEEEMP